MQKAMHLPNGLFNTDPGINLFLSDSGKFSTEWSKLRIDARFHISLENILNFTVFDIDYDNRKFYNLLSFHWKFFLIIRTSAFKIENTDVIKWCLV